MQTAKANIKQWYSEQYMCIHSQVYIFFGFEATRGLLLMGLFWAVRKELWDTGVKSRQGLPQVKDAHLPFEHSPWPSYEFIYLANIYYHILYMWHCYILVMQ